MSKEKQIEEMAKCENCIHANVCVIRGFPSAFENTHWEKEPCDHYCKQSAGEWIDKPTGAYGRWQSWCSACGKHSGIGGIESNRHKPFCPNCGAKMKGV